MGHPRLTEEYKAALWERYAKGESVSRIGRVVGRHPVTVAQFIRDAGGIRPPRASGSQARLSLGEREEISRGLAAGESLRTIAGRAGRAPSTISREVARNGGRRRYLAQGRRRQRSPGTVCVMNRVSRSAREGTRSFGDAGCATRLERWVVVLLVPVGVALGHVGAYRLVYQDHGVRHAALAGHGYFTSFGVAAGVCGIAALLWAVVCERRQRTRRVPVGVLAAMQVAAFTALEIGEDALAGQGVAGALSEPAVWVGLVAQLCVAGLLAISVRWIAPLLAGLVPCAPALPVLPSACVPLRCTASTRRGTRPRPSPCTLRGPPRLTAV